MTSLSPVGIVYPLLHVFAFTGKVLLPFSSIHPFRVTWNAPTAGHGRPGKSIFSFLQKHSRPARYASACRWWPSHRAKLHQLVAQAVSSTGNVKLNVSLLTLQQRIALVRNVLLVSDVLGVKCDKDGRYLRFSIACERVKRPNCPEKPCQTRQVCALPRFSRS